MTTDRSEYETPITAADMERFHRNAPAAVKRREGLYAFDEFGAGLRAVFLGGVPLVGVIWFQWSSTQLLIFLLCGSWIGILCDFAKLFFLEKQVHSWGDAYYEDWHVWVVVDALRLNKTHAPKQHLRAKYEPWHGVLADIVFGGISTVVIVTGLIRSPAVNWAELGHNGAWHWIVAISVYEFVFTAWEILSHRTGADVRPVKVHVALRGLGLFLFMFILMWLTDEFQVVGPGVRNGMIVVNGALILWGLATMAGPLMIRRETQWLREYLAKRER